MQLENRMCDTAREQTEIAASMAWGATKAWAQAHGHTLPFGAEDLLVTAEDIYYANFDRTVDGDVCDWLAAEILSDRGCASAIPRLFDTL